MSPINSMRRPLAVAICGLLMLAGETAVRSGEYEFTEQVDGQTKTRPTRYSFAYQRIEGRWLIVLQHLTAP